MESVISLAPNLFFGTSIAVTVLVLSKSKADNSVQFIDASGLFKSEGKTSVLTDEHINKIIEAFDKKEDVPYLAKSVTPEVLKTNDYNLSVSSYVEAKDTRKMIDINKLNADLKATVARVNKLRNEVDAIVAEIGV